MSIKTFLNLYRGVQEQCLTASKETTESVIAALAEQPEWGNVELDDCGDVALVGLKVSRLSVVNTAREKRPDAFVHVEAMTLDTAILSKSKIELVGCAINALSVGVDCETLILRGCEVGTLLVYGRPNLMSLYLFRPQVREHKRTSSRDASLAADFDAVNGAMGLFRLKLAVYPRDKKRATLPETRPC